MVVICPESAQSDATCESCLFGEPAANLSHLPMTKSTLYSQTPHPIPCYTLYTYYYTANLHISSPLNSSANTSFTRFFLLILPMALRGIWSTTRRTCGIL